MALRVFFLLVCMATAAHADCARPVPSCPAVADLLQQRDGYGRAATGGLDGEFVTVTSPADAGPGTLREAVEGARGPRWVRFASDITIPLQSLIKVPSHVTVDGRGHKVTLLNHGFAIYGAEHVILTDLTIDGRFEGFSQAVNISDFARHVFVTHLDLSRFNDRLVNVKTGSTDVTLSWIKFHDHNKVMLLNNLTTRNVFANYDRDAKTRVTLHHSWFVNTIQRNPRAQFGVFHVYNNLIENWDFYGMSYSLEARATVEGNVFVNSSTRACTEPEAFQTTHQVERNYCKGILGAPALAVLPNGKSDEDAYNAAKPAFGYDRDYRAFLKVRDNVGLGDSIVDVQSYQPNKVPPPPYCYVYEKADAALAQRIRAGAGANPARPVGAAGAALCPAPGVAAAPADGPSGWKLLGRNLTTVEGSLEAPAFALREIDGDRSKRGVTRTLNGSAAQRWSVDLQYRATAGRQLGVWLFDPQAPQTRVMVLCEPGRAAIVRAGTGHAAPRAASTPAADGYQRCHIEATPTDAASAQVRVDLILSEGPTFTSAGASGQAIALKDIRIAPVAAR